MAESAGRDSLMCVRRRIDSGDLLIIKSWQHAQLPVDRATLINGKTDNEIREPLHQHADVGLMCCTKVSAAEQYRTGLGRNIGQALKGAGL
jgi:hypothetical protein